MRGRRFYEDERGAALVEAVLSAVILAVIAVAALSVTSGAAGLLMRGAVQTREVAVLRRALDAARAGQPIPSSIEGFSVSTRSSQVRPWNDAWVVRYSTNPSCQGSCGMPFDAVGQVSRVAVTVGGSRPEAASLAGVTFTAYTTSTGGGGGGSTTSPASTSQTCVRTVGRGLNEDPGVGWQMCVEWR